MDTDETCRGFWRDGLLSLEGGFIAMLLGKMYDGQLVSVRLTTERLVKVLRVSCDEFFLFAESCTGKSGGCGEQKDRCAICQKEFMQTCFYRRAMKREVEISEQLEQEGGVNALIQQHAMFPHRLRENCSRHTIEKVVEVLMEEREESTLRLPNDLLSARLLEAVPPINQPARSVPPPPNLPVRSAADQERYDLMMGRKLDYYEKPRAKGGVMPMTTTDCTLPTADDMKLHEIARAAEASAAADSAELSSLQLAVVTKDAMAYEVSQAQARAGNQAEWDAGQWQLRREVERRKTNKATQGIAREPTCRSARTVLAGSHAREKEIHSAAPPAATPEGKTLAHIIAEYKESGYLDLHALESLNDMDKDKANLLHLHVTDRCLVVDIMRRLMQRIEGKEANAPISAESSQRLYRLFLRLSGAAFNSCMQVFPVASTKGMSRKKRAKAGALHAEVPWCRIKEHTRIFNEILDKMLDAGARPAEILMARVSMLMMDATKVAHDVAFDFASRVLLGLASCGTIEAMFRKLAAARSSEPAQMKDASLASSVVHVYSVMVGIGKVSELLLVDASVVTENRATVAAMSWHAQLLDSCAGHILSHCVTDCLAANLQGLERYQSLPSLFTLEGDDKHQDGELLNLVRGNHPAYGYGKHNTQLPDMMGRLQCHWRGDHGHAIIKSPINAEMNKDGKVVVDETDSSKPRIRPLPYKHLKELLLTYVRTCDRRPAGSLDVPSVLNRDTNSKQKMKVSLAANFTSKRMQTCVANARRWIANMIKSGKFATVDERKARIVFNAIPGWTADAKAKDEANDRLNGWDLSAKKRGNGEGPLRVLKFVGLLDTDELVALMAYSRRLARHADIIVNASTDTTPLTLVANFLGKTTIDNATSSSLSAKSIITQLASNFPGSVHSAAHGKGDGYEKNFCCIKCRAGAHCSMLNFQLSTEKVMEEKLANFERFKDGLPLSSNEGHRRNKADSTTYTHGGNNTEVHYDGYDQVAFVGGEHGPAVTHTLAKKTLARRTEEAGQQEFKPSDFNGFDPQGALDPDDL